MREYYRHQWQLAQKKYEREDEDQVTLSEVYQLDCGPILQQRLLHQCSLREVHSYDRAGNITVLTRYNNSGTGTTLSCAYAGYRRNTFSYDVNGNVTSDAANSLQSSYNLINLPAQDIGSISVRKAFMKYEKDSTPAPGPGHASVLRENVLAQKWCLSQRRVDLPDGRSYLRLGG